jgi:demethylmenaquinone methyltransferase / 2-methoxy-6-polyprenyl-1,4-benzoquinol methylase
MNSDRASGPPADRSPTSLSHMFGAIADHYDLMNRIMTLGQDGRWRRHAAEVADLEPGMVALDVATGTGDLAFALAKQVSPNGHIIGIDVVEAMLSAARRKAPFRSRCVSFERGDALAIPYDANRFDAVTCGFGLRNMDDRLGALREMVRVTRPGRRVVILELTPPTKKLARQYMEQVIPRVGQLVAKARAAYTYLPQSAREFPDPLTLAQLMQQAGLTAVTYRVLNFGTVALHWGTKPK